MYILTALRVGIDNKKDNLAASVLLKLRSLEAEIIIPDLLTPGTKDNIWKNPINRALLKLRSLSIFLFSALKSDKYKITPKIKVVHPIISIFLGYQLDQI